MIVLFSLYGDHRDLHVLTHSFPTRRSSDLTLGGAACTVGAATTAAGAGASAVSFALTGDGRDCRPSRCAFPITALRLTPSPSESAIWLAVIPCPQSAFRLSIRSSVQDIQLDRKSVV